MLVNKLGCCMLDINTSRCAADKPDPTFLTLVSLQPMTECSEGPLLDIVSTFPK